jgi:multicomponent Na+:H+ antiporter subunit E
MLLWNLMLAVAWAMVTGRFTAANFALGFAVGYVVLLATQGRPAARYFLKVRQAVSFFFFFLWELFLANLKVAYDVVTPRHHMKPGVVGIPLDATTDTEINVLANLITLTPGTLSLDVSPDRKTLYIHAMYIDDLDGLRRGIKHGLERRILELLR